MARSDKVVLVTGASSGIGHVTAQYLATRGWRVFAGARRPEVLEGVAGIESVRLDVTDDESVTAAVDTVVARAGRLDGLVNNAGVSLLGAVEEISTDQARALLDTNVLGVIRMSRAVLPQMRHQGSGRIVNISSVVGFLPAPFMAVYAASKHAVEGLSESLDHEVRDFGIRVAVVEPGFTRTNIDAAAPRAERSVDAYSVARDAVAEVISTQIAAAPDPSSVAHAVEQALTVSRYGRFPVGGQARLLALLRRALPSPLLDRAIRRTYDLNGAGSSKTPVAHRSR